MLARQARAALGAKIPTERRTPRWPRSCARRPARRGPAYAGRDLDPVATGSGALAAPGLAAASPCAARGRWSSRSAGAGPGGRASPPSVTPSRPDADPVGSTTTTDLSRRDPAWGGRDGRRRGSYWIRRRFSPVRLRREGFETPALAAGWGAGHREDTVDQGAHGSTCSRNQRRTALRCGEPSGELRRQKFMAEFFNLTNTGRPPRHEVSPGPTGQHVVTVIREHREGRPVRSARRRHPAGAGPRSSCRTLIVRGQVAVLPGAVLGRRRSLVGSRGRAHPAGRAGRMTASSPIRTPEMARGEKSGMSMTSVPAGPCDTESKT